MAFAKSQLPLVVGAEGSATIAAVGEGVEGFAVGDAVTMYGALTCGECRRCMSGVDNLCENVGGVYGFHIHGFARERMNIPARLVVKVPAGVAQADAACAGIAFGTTQHMLFDNAKLEPGENRPRACRRFGHRHRRDPHGQGHRMHGDRDGGRRREGRKAKELGADHVVNYRTERFEGEVRRWTKQNLKSVGVDVVFEHVGADTWNGSLLCLKRGGRLVTCGSTSGVSTTMNLMQLFQQQYRIFGSFGCRIENMRQSLDKMQAGIAPVIDTIFPVEELEKGIERLESRRVFGKILVAF